MWREIKEDDKKKIEKFLLPYTQTFWYGTIQEMAGRKVRRFVFEKGEGVESFFQCVVYPLFKNKKVIYLPYGPVGESLSKEVLEQLRLTLKTVCKEENAVFARADFQPKLSNENAELVGRFFTKALKSTYASSYFQPRSEWCLDITKSEDVLLRGMDSNTRYSIRVGQKKNVEVKIFNPIDDPSITVSELLKQFDSFYFLMKDTAERNKFFLHPKEYYRYFFEECARSKSGFLAQAFLNGELVSTAFIVVSGDTATFLFGASSSDEEHRKSGGSHLLQLHIIRKLKLLGVTVYSFGGVSSPLFLQKGWSGLTAFKKKFGGFRLDHSLFYDYISQPVLYSLYCLRKMLR